MHFTLHRLLSVACALAAALATASAQTRVTYPSGSGVINVRTDLVALGIHTSNAAGDGVADDTLALQRALTVPIRGAATADFRVVYLPDGTYRVRDTLSWPASGSTTAPGGTNITLQGESEAGTVIRLDNSAPGFTSASTPRPLLWTGRDIPERFGHNVRHLTLDTGSGNVGAIGAQYFANNFGAFRQVTVRGSGLIGLDLGFSAKNGPLLVKHVTVDGFATGVRTGPPPQSLTFEHLTLRNQTQRAFHNLSQTVSIRGLTVSGLASGALAGLVNESGHVVLVDATFTGNAVTTGIPAVSNGASGRLLARNLAAFGWSAAIANPFGNAPAGNVAEWSSGGVVKLFASAPDTTLNLPVEETPDVPWDAPSTWANIVDFGATDSQYVGTSDPLYYDNDGPALQAAIDSGATTVFIPAGRFRTDSTVIRIRGNVRRIIGVGSASRFTHGFSYVGDCFVLEAGNAGASQTVVVQDLHQGYGSGNVGFRNASARHLVLKDSFTTGAVISGTGALYLDNVTCAPATTWSLSNTRVFARQFNPESQAGVTTTKITVRNSDLWILGLKTEGAGTVLDLAGGSAVELLGGFFYTLDNTSAFPMVRAVDSEFSLSFNEYLGDDAWGSVPYNEVVSETWGTTARSLLRGNPPAYPSSVKAAAQNDYGTEIVSYVGYRAPTAPPPPPPADVTAGLVARYAFDEAAGLVAADSGTDATANTGTLTNGPLWGTDLVVGSGSLGLDGVNDYVAVPDAANLRLTGDFTISAWFRTGSASTTGLRILSKKIAQSDAAGFELCYQPSTDRVILIGAGSSSRSFASGVNDANWHHVLVTVSGATARCWVDGVERSAVAGTLRAPTAGTQPLNLGRRGGAAAYWSGRLDDIRLYNRVLTGAEIATVFSAR